MVHITDSPAHPYAWVDALDAYCLSRWRGLDIDAALEALTGPPHSVLDADYAEAMQASYTAPGSPQPVQRASLGGHDVCLVPNGWLINVYGPTLTANGGEILSVFWNVNGTMNMSLARNGEQVRSFEPYLRDEGVGSPLEWEALVDWTEEPAPYWNRTQKRSLPHLFALACGQDFDEDWLVHTTRPTRILIAPPG